MAKKHCIDCQRPFQSKFALAAHIRFCPEKKTVKCPECGKTCNKSGVATHRYNKHGVAGTSRWASKNRKPAKKPMILKSLRKKFQDIFKEPVQTIEQTGTWKEQAIKELTWKHEFHQAEIKKLDLAIQAIRELK